MEYLPNKTRIILNQPEHLKGLKGTIVGRVNSSQPFIGASYIIQLDIPSRINSEGYPYDFFATFECCFDVIPQEEVTSLQDMILDYLNQPGVIGTVEAIRNHCKIYHTHEISREIWRMNDKGLIAVISGKITPLTQ
jgi:hypothetical protein